MTGHVRKPAGGESKAARRKADLHTIKIRANLQAAYDDVYTPQALAALAALAPLEEQRRDLMADRLHRRGARAREGRSIAFLNPRITIPGTSMTVQEARDGKFVGSEIPSCLRRQWVQGTGPATRPGQPVEEGIRPVAYGLLSGADGWMFDGEDALGQVSAMSLDNQRHLKLALARDLVFLKAAELVAGEMNAWSRGFFGREIIPNWRRQLDFTTRIFRPRGLHLDDRHIRTLGSAGLSASLVDLVLYAVNNHEALRRSGQDLVLYLPKIQTAEEAVFWNRMLTSLEERLSMPAGAIKVYVLVEQLEACYQLMEIRAALGRHFVGFNTGRWDYINSVADAMAWDPAFIHPNVDSITMTYGYMRRYEDRVRRAANTPDLEGRYALWQGGMEANIPVGSEGGVSRSMKRAVAGADRERREGASGKWVAHWKMVHIIRPVWEREGQDNQMGRPFPPLTYTPIDAELLIQLEPAPRTVRGARDLISVSLQYANAFGRGLQAAALKPADCFGNNDVLYLMEDLATAEIRASILWEWLHKGATLSESDDAAAAATGDRFTADLFARLLREEYAKLLAAEDRDVHEISKASTLPVAREIVHTYVASETKVPWLVDLLNINLDNADLGKALRRLGQYMDAFTAQGVRTTENLDFESAPSAST